MEIDAKGYENFEAARTMHLEKLRRRFFQNLNPIYVWDAVCICNYAHRPPRPLPQWCLDQVVTIAVRMRTLGDLNNPKTYPYDESGLTQDEINDRHSEWQRQKITPAEAVAMLPWVMNVTCPGWNAFARHHAEADDELLANFKDDLPDHLVTKVLARAQRERNISLETVRRRIRRGRRLARPAPLPPDRFPP